MNKILRTDVEAFKAARNVEGKYNVLDRYQQIAGQSANYPGNGTPLGLMYCALKLNGEAGEIAEHVGKALRDDQYGKNTDTDLTAERHLALMKEVGDVLWYCQAVCRELGVTLSEVAIMNLEKLCDRGERNKLHGSGDDR
jgi:NTP pyrophosphatase (non-canonical NTP hydrolase)